MLALPCRDDLLQALARAVTPTEADLALAALRGADAAHLPGLVRDLGAELSPVMITALAERGPVVLRAELLDPALDLVLTPGAVTALRADDEPHVIASAHQLGSAVRRATGAADVAALESTTALTRSPAGVCA